MGRALRVVVDDRVEVHERVVAHDVLVRLRCRLGLVLGSNRRVAVVAERAIAGRVLAHVLHVAAPGRSLGGELVPDRRDRGRVDATDADRLSVGAARRAHEVDVEWGIGLRVGIRALAAHEAYVVVEALVPGPEVAGDKGAPGPQRPREVWGLRILAEALL